MAHLGRRDTNPELTLRRALHARGLRFRVAYPVPGLRRRTIDVAFTRARVAVFVDGCFWHGCPEHGTWPKANSRWWVEKISTNQARDRHTTAYLGEIGWQVLRFWDHAAPGAAALAVAATLRRITEPSPSASTARSTGNSAMGGSVVTGCRHQAPAAHPHPIEKAEQA